MTKKTTTVADAPTLDDAALDRALGAALLDQQDVTPFEAERARRQRERDRAALAAAEQARRQAGAEAHEAAMLLGALTEQFDQLVAGYRAALDALDAHPTQANCERVHVCALAACALGHELVAITGQRVRFAFHYAGLTEIEARGGLAGRAYSLRRPRPTVEQPWARDLARLREIAPRVSATIQNGG